MHFSHVYIYIYILSIYIYTFIFIFIWRRLSNVLHRDVDSGADQYKTKNSPPSRVTCIRGVCFHFHSLVCCQHDDILETPPYIYIYIYIYAIGDTSMCIHLFIQHTYIYVCLYKYNESSQAAMRLQGLCHLCFAQPALLKQRPTLVKGEDIQT